MSSSFHSCIRWKISSSAHWWIHRTFQPPTIPRRRPDEYLSKTSVIVRRSVMHNRCKGTPRIFYWSQDLRAEGCERGSWGGSRNPLPTSSGRLVWALWASQQDFALRIIYSDTIILWTILQPLGTPMKLCWSCSLVNNWNWNWFICIIDT